MQAYNHMNKYCRCRREKWLNLGGFIFISACNSKVIGNKLWYEIEKGFFIYADDGKKHWGMSDEAESETPVCSIHPVVQRFIQLPASLWIIQDKKNEFVSNYHIHKYVEEVEIEFSIKEVCIFESLRVVSIIGKGLCTQCRCTVGKGRNMFQVNHLFKTTELDGDILRGD